MDMCGFYWEAAAGVVYYGGMTVAEEQEDPVEVCPKCMAEVTPGAHFCKACMAPLDSFAATDPVGSIQAQFSTFNTASKHAPKLIVLVGMWLVWGPTAIAILILFFNMAYALFFSSAPFAVNLSQRFTGVMGGGLLLVMGGLYLVVGLKYLYSTTKNYLREKRAGATEEEEEDTELAREALAAGNGESEAAAEE